jgi:catechol 2,3-dioxygenase-like lactoylglutathione lyase family enzyme
MRKHIQGIDHVVIVVRDLDAARDTFSRMGFTVTPRGYHTLGSQNHCVMFGDDYLELLWSPEGSPHPSRQYYTDFARGGEGVAAIALKSDDARGAYSEMLWAGFEPSDPVEFSRPVQLPDGAREASFRVSMAAPDRSPGARLFVCEHLTRAVVWRPEYQRHEVGATALAAVAIVADEARTAARPYERFFDATALPIAEGVLVETGGAPIAFAAPRMLARRLPGVSFGERRPPYAAALFIRVADRDAAAAVLEAGGLRPARMPDGSVAIGADRAHGTVLVFG